MNNDFLYGLVVQLRAKGINIGTRDFLEGLEAFSLYKDRFVELRQKLEAAQRPRSRESIRGVVIQTRSALAWICQSLWARSAQERQTIERVIHDEIPLPDNQIIFRLLTQFQQVEKSSIQPLEYTEPEASYTRTEEYESSESTDAVEAEQQASAKDNRLKTGKSAGVAGNASSGADIESGLLEIQDQRWQYVNIPIPTLEDKHIPASPSYNWVIESELSELWLITLWRRLYKPTRQKDRDLIDIDKTVDQFCQTGVLLAPQMRDRVFNAAELLLLVDTDYSMAPWASVTDLIIKTAMSKLSRLRKTEIYYFNRTPGSKLFTDPQLMRWVHTEKVLSQNAKAAVMVLSNTGTTAGVTEPFNKDRLQGFLNEVLLRTERKIAWIHPMPSHRRLKTFKKALEGFPFVHVSTLSSRSLLHAVEHLRAQL